MSKLKVMKGVSNIAPLEEEYKQQNEKKKLTKQELKYEAKDNNNSTLEISFNHNEIKGING